MGMATRYRVEVSMRHKGKLVHEAFKFSDADMELAFQFAETIAESEDVLQVAIRDTMTHVIVWLYVKGI